MASVNELRIVNLEGTCAPYDEKIGLTIERFKIACPSWDGTTSEAAFPIATESQPHRAEKITAQRFASRPLRQ